MNNVIDYSNYDIRSTKDFDKGLLHLKSKRDKNSEDIVNKLFKIIDTILTCGIDEARQQFNLHNISINPEIWETHISPQGRTTGDDLLTCKIYDHIIEFDLRLDLQNITDHNDLDRVSSPRYVSRQELHKFDIVKNKYSESAISYAEDCLDYIRQHYIVFNKSGDERTNLIEKYKNEYISFVPMPNDITIDDLGTILLYLDNIKRQEGKSTIFSSVEIFCNSSNNKETGDIKEYEESYILNIFDRYNVYIKDAYIESEIDEYGDKYIDMYVITYIDDYKILKLIEKEFDMLKDLFNIMYEFSDNGFGRYGKTYDFYHYFI